MAKDKTNSLESIAQIGPIIQMAFVPDDFEQAIRHWTKLIGAGPFFMIEHLPLQDVKYRGSPTQIDTSIALGYWGEMQIELICQHDKNPSAYQEWLNSNRQGLHHVCISVSNIQQVRKSIEAMGGTPVHEARMEGAAEAAYFEIPGFSPIIEVAELDPKFEKLFSYMKDISKTWDGNNPVRPVPPEEEWLGASSHHE